MRSFKKHNCKGILLSLFLFFATLSHAQKIIVCDQVGRLYYLDVNNCSFTQINDWGTTFGQAYSIALYKDTLYVLNTNSQIYSMVLNQPASCKFITNATISNAMTVDENGMLYIFNDGIEKINPHDGTRVNLGRPGNYTPSGDLFFFNKKMYMAAAQGIVEINIQDMSQSYVYIPTSSHDFWGLINVPAGCNSNKVYGVTNALYEIDITTKTVANAPKCVVDPSITIYDAASITENGYSEGVNIDSLFLKNICIPGVNTGGITVKAGTAATNATLTYTINGASPNTDGIFNNLSEGQYALKVTSSNTCFKDTTATLVKGPKPNIFITPAADTCASSVGSVVLQSTIGNAPIRYALDNGSPIAGNTFMSLSTKTYHIQAITNIGCTIDSAFNISSYKPPTPLQAFTTTQEICDPGSITLTYSNAVKKLRLDNGADSYSNTFLSLKANTYTVSLFTNYCTYDTLIEVKKEAPVPPAITIVADTPTCFNKNDGTLRFAATSKYGSYTLQLNGALTGNRVFPGLANGSYKFTLKDNAGCMWDTTATLQYQRIKPVTTIATTDATCWILSNGTATATITGQEQPYTFSYENAVYNSGSTANNFNSGSYALQINNKNNCTVDTVTAVIGRLENKLQVAAIVTTPSFCNSATGTITFNMKPNAGQIMFSMNNATPTPTPVFNNLVSGLYNFQLRDLNNCTADTSTTISIVNLPSPLKEIKATAVICEKKASIQVILQPGKTGSSFQLNNGTPQNNNLFTDVNDGKQLVSFMYSGCPFDTTVTIIKTTTKKPDISISNKEVDCYNRNNGAISVRANNEAFPYTFSYNNSAFIPDANIYNLAPGDYTIRIRDSYGCLWDTSTTLKKFQLIKPAIATTTKTPVCFIDERAGLQVSLNGPESPYKFIVNSTSYFSGSEAKLLPGMYNVYINNNTGCLLDSIKTDLSFSQTGTLPCDSILVPTAFTPNNDLRNDVLRPRGNYGFVADYSFTIFNRMGQQIFHSTDLEKGWNGMFNGALQPFGTYVWILSYKTNRGKSIQQKGTVVLMQ